MPEPNHRKSDEEYVRRIGLLYDHILSLRKNSNFVVNQPQMDKLVHLLDFFIKMTKVMDGEVDPVDLQPAEEHGGVTARFWYFSIAGKDVETFASVIRHCSALSIDCLDTGEVCISCTIPNVFIPKKS